MDRLNRESALSHMRHSYLWVVLSQNKPMRNAMDNRIVESWLEAAFSSYEELELEADTEEEIKTVWKEFNQYGRKILRKYSDWTVDQAMVLPTHTGETQTVWTLVPVAFDSMEHAVREIGRKSYGIWRVTSFDTGRSFVFARE